MIASAEFSKIEIKEKTKEIPKARPIEVIVDKAVSDLGLRMISGIVENMRVKKKHEGLEKVKEKIAKEVNLKDK